jgi:hypothetical protein
MGRLLLLVALALTHWADGRLASSTGHAIEAHTESKVATKVHAAAPAKTAAASTAAAPPASGGGFDPGGDYKKRERPPSQGPGTPPTSVFVNLDIHQLYGINPLDGTASVRQKRIGPEERRATHVVCCVAVCRVLCARCCVLHAV